MIRAILVTVGFIVGWGFAFQSALYAACFYLWIAYFRPEAWAWTPVFASLPLSLLAGIFLLIRAMASPVKFRLDLRNGLLFLFLAHSLLSTVFAPEPDYSLRYLQEFAKTVIVSYLLSVLITTEDDFRLVITVIALSLGLEAAKQGWAQFVLNPGATNNNTIPFLGDNNLVAVGMAMLLPIIGSLSATSASWQKRGWQFLGIGVLYRGISTYSRGGLLAVSTVGLIYLWRSPNKIRTMFAFAVAIALILPALPPEFWDRMSTISAPAEERDDSQQSRLHFWKVGVAMANEPPFLGVGHRGFEANYNRYDSTGGLYGQDRAVHSSWFGILAEVGYPGMALFVLIILSSLMACRKVRLAARRGEIPDSLGRYAIGFQASLASFVVGGTFVSFHYSEMLWHFFALTMALERVALVAAETHRSRGQATVAPDSSIPTVGKAEPEPEFAWG